MKKSELIVHKLAFKKDVLNSIGCYISPKDHIFMPLLMSVMILKNYIK